MKKQCKKDSKGQQKIGDVFRIIFPNFNEKYAFFPIKNGSGSFEKETTISLGGQRKNYVN